MDNPLVNEIREFAMSGATFPALAARHYAVPPGCHEECGLANDLYHRARPMSDAPRIKGSLQKDFGVVYVIQEVRCVEARPVVQGTPVRTDPLARHTWLSDRSRRN